MRWKVSSNQQLTSGWSRRRLYDYLGIGLPWIAVIMSAAAVAQPSPAKNYTTIEIKSEAPAQIGYYGSATKTCSPAPLPTIRVIEAPRYGTLTVRRGELTSHNTAGCTELKVPAQVLFYQARKGSTGLDHMVYEVTSSNGEVAVYDTTLDIKEPAKTVPSNNGRGI